MIKTVKTMLDPEIQKAMIAQARAMAQAGQ